MRNMLPLLLLLPGPAMAEGWYLKAFGGASSLGDTDIAGAFATNDQSFETGPVAGAALGYAYPGTPFAAEIEFAYRSGDGTRAPSVGDFASTALMLNAVYSRPVSAAATLYLGAGIGTLTEIDYDITTGATEVEFSDRGGLAGQLFAGVDYDLSERWSAFGEVRYFDAGSVTLDSDATGSLDADYATLDAIIGIKLSF